MVILECDSEGNLKLHQEVMLEWMKTRLGQGLNLNIDPQSALNDLLCVLIQGEFEEVA